MKKKKTKKVPAISTADLLAMRKTEAVLVRMSKQDKNVLFETARRLQLTVTELLTRLARMASEKLLKGR